VSVRDQFLGCRRADKSGRAGNKYAHEKHSLFRRTEYWYSAYSGKVVILYRYNR
jgi:membrane protein DedA with SNARE-associated domain